jgi:hypothetical protein
MCKQNDSDQEYFESRMEDICKRCECCETYWKTCYKCGGKGEFDYDEDLQFEDPLWYSPGDTEECDICEGAGGWTMCLGHCDENGKHLKM